MVVGICLRVFWSDVAVFLVRLPLAKAAAGANKSFSYFKNIYYLLINYY